MGVLRILLADDHEVLRKGLRSVLETQHDCEVVGEAADGRQAVAMANDLRPDIAILDISMPSLDGLEATRRILKTRPETRVLILTMHESDTLIRQLLEAGAQGYLLKSDAGRDLTVAVEALRRRKMHFTSKVAQMMVDGFLERGAKSRDAATEGTRLTSRQRQIVELLAVGKSSKEVATALGISEKTAEAHRGNIMRRLDCHSVSDLVRYAAATRLLTHE